MRGMPQKVRQHLARSTACIALGTVIAAGLAHEPPPPPRMAERGVALWSLRALDVGDSEIDGESCAGAPAGLMALPTGAPSALQCDQARVIVAQARSNLAAPVEVVDPAKFADALVDWLDPHGLWSVAHDTPIGPLIRAEASRLLAEIQAEPGSGPCTTSLAVGTELSAWVGQLREIFDQGYGEAGASGKVKPPPSADAFRLAASAPFEDGAVTRRARDLARDLGRHAKAIRAAYGEALTPYTTAARDHITPSLSPEAWSHVVIAAALRAYIPQLDVHGAWAPLDEEISIYDLALETNPPERLWSEMTRTALGVRIDRGALAPLQDGDVVLRIHGVTLSGVSVEQAEQLAVVGDEGAPPATVTVLRARAAAPLDLVVQSESTPGLPAPPQTLHTDLLHYGGGHAAVIAISDVPDDLGARLSSALDHARRTSSLQGVVLDMRSNGGGSTDGAAAALGIFLPGAALFPMRRRDGAVEVERAAEVAPDQQWRGPLAVLVDGDSASAAEMIAGAIASYKRGIILGDRTYGKGCAQEYLDDDAHAGVLRLTTLLFALPDGSPVQKTGVTPQVLLSLPGVTEREALLSRALDPWRGPDVRDRAQVREVPWPAHGGRIGPCRDETLCRALRALGASPAASR